MTLIDHIKNERIMYWIWFINYILQWLNYIKEIPKEFNISLKTFFVEESFSKEVAKSAYDSIFNTECGRSICREMFGRSWLWKPWIKSQKMNLKRIILCIIGWEKKLFVQITWLQKSSYIEITKILMLEMKMDMLLNIQRIRAFHNETVLGQMRSQWYGTKV